MPENLVVLVKIGLHEHGHAKSDWPDTELKLRISDYP